MGRLCDTVTYRDLYDARMQSNMTVTDFFLNGNGQWPEEWRYKFPMITQIGIISIQNDKPDCLM
ncbi:hypothetical protein Tco_1544530, partial [Tanacetum coccineum]